MDSILSRRALLGAASLAFAGAGGAHAAHSYHTEPPRYPGPDEGLVYIFRPTPPGGNLRMFSLSIDGRKFMTFEGGDYSWLYLSPGVHDFTFEMQGNIWYRPDVSIQTEIEAAQINYIRLTTVPLPGTRPFSGGRIMLHVNLDKIGKREAIDGMRRTVYRKPKLGWLTP
jgi:hypothetical protein